MGRGLRIDNSSSATVAENPSATASSSTDFLDPALIELASQDGYSVEIFPESKGFSPIDQEMMSALAPTEEAPTWERTNRGSVVPITYISNESKQP